MKNLVTIALTVAIPAGAAGAQATSLPPVRTLAAPIHVSAELVGRAPAALRLASGRVLVNDVLSRRLILFDSTLATYTIAVDSASDAKVPYGARPGALIAFRGDSSLFIDPASLSMMVLDGNAELIRVMAIPNPDYAGLISAGGAFGIAGFDAKGRLVFRGPTPRQSFNGPDGKPLLGPYAGPDSAAIVRYDRETRKLDTITLVKIPRATGTRTLLPNGSSLQVVANNPLAPTDEWIVLRNGTLAVFRTSDYHLDWFTADGVRTSSPKVAFEWRRLDDSTKAAFVDSLIAVTKKNREDQQSSGRGPVSIGGGGSGGQGPPPWAPPPVELLVAKASELPDYAPPFANGTARQDYDGNIWIRTTLTQNGGPIYDVIDLKGKLIDRVSLPSRRAIAGFGPGVVYLAVREGAGTRLEVVKVH